MVKKSRLKRSYIRVALVTIAASLGLASILGIDRPTNTTEFTQLDFVPNGTTNYDITCTGNRPSYSDVKLYTPQLMLSEPVDVEHTLVFVVKEDRSFWPDTELGLFNVTIPAGSTSMSAMSTVADGGSGADYVPDGAADPETQGFWLACTAKCKVRGNKARGDDGSANVYIEMQDWQPAPGTSMRIVGDHQSTRHIVNCRSAGSGSGSGGTQPMECETMADCPPGDCVPGVGIGHYECARGECRCLHD